MSLLEKLKKLLKDEESPDITQWITEGKGGFKLLSKKDIEANPLLEGLDWLGWYTNNFKDLEDEIISEYALKDYVDAVRAGEIPYPELWFSHILGTKHGQASKLWHVGHFVIAGGTFDPEESNPLVKSMKSWYAKQDLITMSHGFMYDPALKMNGVYYHLETYEISSLLSGSEANPFTKFEVKELMTQKTVSEAQRLLLEQELGKDFADAVVARAETLGDELRNRGQSFKSLPSQDSEGLSIALYAVTKELASVLKASQEAEKNKTGDIDNRLTAVETSIGDLGDKVLRMTQAFKDLTKKQPAASKAPMTEVDDEDEDANNLEKENNQGDKPKSVLEKWRTSS